jgi:hypothetical protein
MISVKIKISSYISRRKKARRNFENVSNDKNIKQSHFIKASLKKGERK